MPGDTLSPFVYWAQDRSKIYLRVDLRDVADSNVQIDSQKVRFSGVGEGAMGLNRYGFELDLCGPVDPQESIHKIGSRSVEFVLKKNDTGLDWWPRLLGCRTRPSWLRLDFDRWRDPPGYEEAEEKLFTQMSDMDMRKYDEQQASDIVEQLTREMGKDSFQPPNFRVAYLVVYNIILTAGFVWNLVEIFSNYAKDGSEYFPRVYEEVGPRWWYCQAAQWLEVLHVIVGFVPGNPFAPLMQNFSRTFVLFLLHTEPRLQEKPFVFYLFIVWGGIEIVRYPYYALSALKKEVGILTWLRYTMWIPLYPTGITIEGVIILRAIPYFFETEKFGFSLFGIPNLFPYLLGAYILIGLLPGGAYLIGLMRSQRKKKLGPKVRKPVTKTKKVT